MEPSEKKLKSTRSRAESKKDLHRFSAQDICAIIETCGKSGVKNFKTANLEFTFGVTPEPADSRSQIPAEMGSNQITGINLNEISDDQKEILAQYEDAQKLIDDPEGFEMDAIDLAIKDGTVENTFGKRTQ